MNHTLHPQKALFDPSCQLPAIPSCEHFAGNKRFIEKAFAIQACSSFRFDVTCDCEDGAKLGNEDAHAKEIVELILANISASNSNRVMQRVGIRIHDPLDPQCKRDLDIILPKVGALISYIVLPKVRSAAHVAETISYARTLSKNPTLLFHVLIETHQALREIEQIASLPHIETLDFGLLDFISEHQGAIPEHCMTSPGQFEHHLIVSAKTKIAQSALGHGLIPSHNITTDITAPEKVTADAKRAAQEFGYLRMWSIHPMQIEPIVKAFAPSYTELERASEILLAGHARAWAPLQHAGKLHDRASYRYYWHLLERAVMAGQNLAEPVKRTFFM